MKSFKNMPIRRKLIAIIVLTSVVVMVLMLVSFFTYEYLTLRQTTTRQLATVGKVIAANSTASLAFANQNDAAETLSALKAEPQITAAALYGNDGKLFSKYPASLPDNVLPAAPQADGFQFEHGCLAGFQPVLQDGKRLGTLYLKYDMRVVVHEWLTASINVAVVVMTVALLVAYLFSQKLQKQISRPILALAGTAKEISDHRDYSVRAKRFGEDELGLLTDAFNQMLEQVQKQNLDLSRFAAIVKSSDDAIISKDLSGIVTSWNSGAEKLFGYTALEAIGRPMLTFIPPGREQEEAEILAKIARGESIEHLETVRVRKDGRRIDVSVTISPVKDSQGKVVGASKIARDITGRKQTEQNLRALLKEVTDLKAALDEHAIVAITDPQGRITYVNDKFCAISKYSREELLGQDHRIINSGYHPKEFIRDLWTTIARGQVWKGEIKNRAKDGTFYWVDTTIVPFLKDDGKPRQYVAIRADITERKRAEAEIRELNAELEARVARRTVELEAANHELEAFSYSISHDLRAPLRAVNGFAEIVLEDFSPQLPEEGRRHLERIRNGGQRMGELIDNLLAFSRLSRQVVTRQPVDTAWLAQSVLDELKPERNGRAVEIKIGELPVCHGDPAMLKQVWVNLISNAIKYTRGRDPAVIEIGCASDHGAKVFFVRDNGAGFDMQYANKLFGVFQRLHRTDEFEGTGVGLAIVQRIVHRHGGRVWADAKLNAGATFYFTIGKEDGT